MTTVDVEVLEAKVKGMYRLVSEQPHGVYHFEMGRTLAERLGYEPELLEAVPVEAVESFAGVGYFFGLAQLVAGERVIDLGSGSGMDACCAARLVAPTGRVVGVDFTPEQLGRARRLAAAAGLEQVEFREGRIENLPAEAESFDCVISNGVINLSPDKARVFAEAARVLRPGGRLAIADIVTERQLTESIVCDADLWAAASAELSRRTCISGRSRHPG
jgi:SAM-dependent methyltransferase